MSYKTKTVTEVDTVDPTGKVNHSRATVTPVQEPR